MRDCFQPRLPFLDDIGSSSDIVNCSFHDGNNKSWKAKKETLGLLKHNLTYNLDKTGLGFPKVKAYHGEYPDSLIGLNDINQKKNKNLWLHGFSEDCVLDKIWNRPLYFADKIGSLGGMLTPDFSLYLNMTPIEKQMNVFRKNAISQIFQKCGINVIYTLCWAEYDSLEYCADGIEPYGIYAVSNIGVNKNYVSRKIFRVGLKELIRRLMPEGLIVYGYPLDFEIDCKYRVYENKNLKRLHSLRR